MAMHRGGGFYGQCREIGAGAGIQRIMTSGAWAPRSDSIWMMVGSLAVAGASRACRKVNARRYREASAAPNPKGKKFGEALAVPAT